MPQPAPGSTEPDVRPRVRAAAGALALVAVMLLSVVSCGEPASDARPPATIDRETFVEVYVALRRAQSEAGSEAAFEAARDGVLERHGVTADELATFIDVYGRDIERMVEVWDEIEQRLAEAPGDSVAA